MVNWGTSLKGPECRFTRCRAHASRSSLLKSIQTLCEINAFANFTAWVWGVEACRRALQWARLGVTVSLLSRCLASIVCSLFFFFSFSFSPPLPFSFSFAFSCPSSQWVPSLNFPSLVLPSTRVFWRGASTCIWCPVFLCLVTQFLWQPLWGHPLITWLWGQGGLHSQVPQDCNILGSELTVTRQTVLAALPLPRHYIDSSLKHTTSLSLNEACLLDLEL